MTEEKKTNHGLVITGIHFEFKNDSRLLQLNTVSVAIHPSIQKKYEDEKKTNRGKYVIGEHERN